MLGEMGSTAGEQLCARGQDFLVTLARGPSKSSEALQ